MRPGPARGTSAQLTLTVTGDMVDAGREPSLPVTYGVVATAEHVARACRDLVTPYLEVGETAVPTRLEVNQRSPVAVGETVTHEATVQMVQPSRLTCEVLVRWRGVVVTRASFEQEVVPIATEAARRAAGPV